MTKLQTLTLLSVLGMLATTGPVFAREVQLLDFNAVVRPTAISEERASQFGQRQEPAEEAPGADPAPVVSFPRMHSVVVPLWMRPPSYSAVPPIARTAIDTRADCATPYRPNPRLSDEVESRRFRYFPLVIAVACEAGIPGHLFDALITQESRYNPMALSPKGAAGLTQLMPDTASSLGVTNRFDAFQNLRGGAKYLRSQLDEFGRYDLALGAYNAGPGRIRRFKALPPFRETIAYVRTILTDVRTALVGKAGYTAPAPAPTIRSARLLGF